MNLPSDTDAVRGRTMPAFGVSEGSVAPFEFRSLTCEDIAEIAACDDTDEPKQINGTTRSPLRAWAMGKERAEGVLGRGQSDHEMAMPIAVEAARQEGHRAGEQEGRRTARAEMEVEMQAAIARERARLVDVVKEFRGVRERYFTEVEQEVVKLSLAIAGRVLHREAQIDPLLLAGVVRVALEKMADRSCVVLRVAAADVSAWEQVFHAMEDSERPRVAEDTELERGECVLETKMGTVELGVKVQLEEIEKGFFDLLNHRPVE